MSNEPVTNAVDDGAGPPAKTRRGTGGLLIALTAILGVIFLAATFTPQPLFEHVGMDPLARNMTLGMLGAAAVLSVVTAALWRPGPLKALGAVALAGWLATVGLFGWGVYLMGLHENDQASVVLESASDGYLDAAVSPDGKLVAAVGKDGALTIWNLPAGEKLAEATVDVAETEPLAWSRDSRYVACGEAGGARVFSADGEEVRRFRMGTPEYFKGTVMSELAPYAMDFTEDGDRLLLASNVGVEAFRMKGGKKGVYYTEALERGQLEKLVSLLSLLRTDKLSKTSDQDAATLWFVLSGEASAIDVTPDGKHAVTAYARQDGYYKDGVRTGSYKKAPAGAGNILVRSMPLSEKTYRKGAAWVSNDLKWQPGVITQWVRAVSVSGDGKLVGVAANESLALLKNNTKSGETMGMVGGFTAPAQIWDMHLRGDEASGYELLYTADGEVLRARFRNAQLKAKNAKIEAFNTGDAIDILSISDDGRYWTTASQHHGKVHVFSDRKRIWRWPWQAR